MGFFGKNNREDEYKSLQNDSLLSDEDDIVIPASKRRSAAPRVGQGNIHAPHAITPEELKGGQLPDAIPMERPKPDSVYKSMIEREQQSTLDSMGDDYVPSWATAKEETVKPVTEVTSNSVTVKKFDTVVSSSSAKAVESTSAPTSAKVTDKPQPIVAENKSSAADSDFLERCRIAAEKATGEDLHTETTPVTYTIEEDKPAESEEKPSTRSIDEIIKMLRGNAENEVANTAFADDSKSEAEEKPTVFEDEPTIKTEQAAETGERKVQVEVIPMDSEEQIMRTATPENGESDVRVYGRVVKGAVLQHTPDGDVDVSELIKAKATDDTIVVDDKTIMFGDLGDIISKRADDDLDAVKTAYDDSADYDYDDEDDYYDEQPYYESEDPDCAEVEDYKSLNDAARLRVKLAGEKSKNKTLTVFTAVAAIASMLLFLVNGSLPLKTIGLIEFIILLAATIVNLDIFFNFKTFFKRPTFDCCVGLGSALMLIQSAVSTFAFNGKYCGFGAIAVVLLAINRLTHLFKSSRVLKGLELIADSEDKRAVVSVGGSNANIIASGAVEGEALVLCDRKVTNVQDYIKNCTYKSPFDLTVKYLLYTASIISLILGLAVGFLSDAGFGFTVAAVLITSLFPATAALICELPMYLASKKAADYGAMLAGYKGAYELNSANLVAVTSSDLFPEGSIRLFNMKTLGENEIGSTLLYAGAVAKAAKSPLSSIFDEIIGQTDNTYPQVNGVQYEDKMGISGWIGDCTILIGNRNLMQGHNITVPPASVDQKILRAGYFPVYIAVGGVPCLLFMVEYSADETVAHELQVLCSTGMTVVVDPKDPNASSTMLCDYFGIPNDALRVMNHNGRVSYERTTAKTESASTSAAFKNNICGLFSAVSSSINLTTTYRILTALAVISAVLVTLLMAYLLIASKLSLTTALIAVGVQLLFATASFVVAKLRS